MNQDDEKKKAVTVDDSADFFGQLYRDNREMIYKIALGLTGNSHDAEEVTQEAFLRAFCRYGDFRGECAFSTWVCRIAINCANGYLRQRKKFPAHALTEDLGYDLSEILDPNPATNPETELLAHQIRLKCLHSLTECLPIEQRKVFCLAITLGLPHKLVAEILECSVGSVKTALHRAKSRWFGYMEDRCQLIDQSGSCSCSQWIRFGASQGWFTPETAAAAAQARTVQVKEEIGQLKALRALYQNSSPATADDSFVTRIREGLKNGEWTLFSR